MHCWSTCVSPIKRKRPRFRFPSQSTYDHLLALHPNVLIQCPCSRISTSYETLLTIDFDFHPICSSDFVSSDWLDVAFANGNWSAYDRRDFRIRAFAYFSQLASLCALTNKILTNELESFAQRELISTLLIPSEKFDAQFQTIFDEFRVSLASTSIRTLHLFRRVLQGNQLLSIYTTNWMLVRSQTIWDPLQTIPLSHGPNCSCATSNECVEPIIVRLTNDTIIEIPGLLLGCLPIESLLRSTLVCFYNQTCVNILAKYLNSTSSGQMNFTALNSTENSGFLTNTTIHDLVSILFADSTTWKVNASYSTFFARCQPAVCIYTLQTRNDALFVLTSILGFYGGLMKIFRYLVPMAMTVYMLVLQRAQKIRSNRIATSMTIKL